MADTSIFSQGLSRRSFVAAGAAISASAILAQFGMPTVAHAASDTFIYAIAGEEFGLAASAGIILLFGALLGCGAWIAYRAQDRFGRYLGLGLTVLLCFEAGFNMGMVMGYLPTKGLALPFLSYGGSSLMASLVAAGLLLNIARQSFLAEDAAPSSMRNALQHI